MLLFEESEREREKKWEATLMRHPSFVPGGRLCFGVGRKESNAKTIKCYHFDQRLKNDVLQRKLERCVAAASRARVAGTHTAGIKTLASAVNIEGYG